MPGVSGRKVCHEAKKIKGAAIPVIGMSGTPWLLAYGEFDHVLAKPFSMKELIKTISNVTPLY